ncbi:hypothetical protein SSPNP10_21530 [Streptomyces sp. NP10]|nr:hypothetical protein SSPNP10_21530 [Streptomyces sp. NP10]
MLVVLGAEQAGHDGGADVLPALTAGCRGRELACRVSGVRRGDRAADLRPRDRQGPVGMGDGGVEDFPDGDGGGVVVAQSAVAGVGHRLVRIRLVELDRGDVRGCRSVRRDACVVLPLPVGALLEVREGPVVVLLGDRRVARQIGPAPGPGHQDPQRPVLAVHVAQRVAALGSRDGEERGFRRGSVLLGPVREEDVDGGQSASGRVGPFVQLIDGVADFGDEQFGGEPALRLTELPARQFVRGGLGTVGERGGHPAGPQLLLELLDRDQAPAVDESVGVDEEVGEEVPAVADEGVSPGSGYADAVRDAIGDPSADHPAIVPQRPPGGP